MSFKELVDRMLGRYRAPQLERERFTAHEQKIVQRLARVRKQSPDAVRAEARRRALQIEVDSHR